MSTTVEPALWMTVPGARPRVALGWLAWLGVAVFGAPPVVATLGPAGGALAWWAWAPTAVAAVVVAGASALALAAGLGLAERAVALAVAHARRVRLDRAGIAFRGGRRGRVIPWSRVQVARVEHG